MGPNRVEVIDDRALPLPALQGPAPNIYYTELPP